ncbi:MAG: universal stress protein [Chloroflexi bacterium]|nr:universal stress protein [Chloroflexota bacterium]
MMFEKILVPLDGSALAEQALPVAIHLAKQMQSELILLSVARHEPVAMVEPMGYGMWLSEEAQPNIREQLDAYLTNTMERYTVAGVTMTSLLKEGDEAGEIVDTAVSQLADLIIMTTHGRSGLSRWLMGSVTEKVMHQAPCPLLILRDSTLPEHILITLDGSEIAETALLPGLALATGIGVDVTLLQVLEGSLPPPHSGDWVENEMANAGQEQEYNKDKERHVTLYLRTIADRFSHHAPKTAVPFGKPAEAILSYAESIPNSLITIATHGRSGLARWIFGSVAEKVLRGATEPVLVIRLDVGRLQ